MRSIYKRLLSSISVASILSTFFTIFIFPAQQAPNPNILQQAAHTIEGLTARVNNINNTTNTCVRNINASVAMAHNANEASINARQVSNHALADANRAITLANELRATIEQLREIPEQVEQQTQASVANLGNEFNRLRAALANQHEHGVNRAIEVERAGINERNRLGLFEQEGRFHVQAVVGAETEKWNKIQETIDDPQRILKIVAAIAAIVLIIYVAKYGIPLLIDYLGKPRVITETSQRGWFEWGKPQPTVKLDDLTFTPALQEKLFDLALHIKTAKMYGENLPNILFYGPPGTGKTSFAKALAYYSDLDYAITSGSEFAKITDLNSANNELRKLLRWGKKSDHGLIIFIDEIESLFANRKLCSTSKAAQDFINTFLALVPEGSQENVMFVFATNHPFKLDDAIIDRIATKIEFTLPEHAEREKILTTYLEKFAQACEQAIVGIDPEVIKQCVSYANRLKGLSPRIIKIIAEKMIIYARRQENKLLTDDIVRMVLDEAKDNLEQVVQWGKERDEWVASQA